jgi:hypothetical protein
MGMKIVSGGQTGVDRGALEAAITLGMDHGGWCPLGRLAEDGRVPDRYQLCETDSPDYAVRTERNVVDSDATLVLYRGRLSGGTKLTVQLARRHRRPCLRVDLDAEADFEKVRRWLRRHHVEVLNVAGPRESQSPGITATAMGFLVAVFDSAEESAT